MKRRIQACVAPAEAGTGVLDWLARRFPYQDRDGWALRLAEGRLRVNGAVAEPACRLDGGDRVEFMADDLPEPPVSFEVRLLHADDEILVVDKPANLPCHPAGRYFRHTLWAWLQRECGVEAPSIVNRLDRETSGVVLVALNARAAARCRRQFEVREVDKRYLAVVEGEFPGVLDARGWMVPDPGSGVRKRRAFVRVEAGGGGAGEAPAGADWAETRFERRDCRGGLSLVAAFPRTGRLHQIRATLCSLGFPVVGDKLYGPDPLIFIRFCTDALTEEDRGRLRLGRQALHAGGLVFRHPLYRRVMEFEVPLPADMAGVMLQKNLRKNPQTG